MDKKSIGLVMLYATLALAFLLDHFVYLDIYNAPILFCWLAVTSIISIKGFLPKVELEERKAETDIEKLLRQSQVAEPTQPEPVTIAPGPQAEPLGAQLANYIVQHIQQGHTLKAIIEALSGSYPPAMVYEVVNYLTAQNAIKPEMPSMEPQQKGVKKKQVEVVP